MGYQNMRNLQDMNLVLSTDAKPRLKWVPELHQQFADAVHQLGGADKATPKSLMKVMGVPGLTLYHLKSHLQKYRLGKNQFVESSDDSIQEDTVDSRGGLELYDERSADPTLNCANESLQLAKTIQLQMEVQRKLHEQIEVQRHLQLRIEAQAKYLQKVLKKAQDALSASTQVEEHAEADLSQLISMAASPSFSSSVLTESRGFGLHNLDGQHSKAQACSVESSLTSETSSRMRMEEKEPKVGEATNRFNHNPVFLQMFDQSWKNGSTHQPCDNKRRRWSAVSEEKFGGDLSSSKRVAMVSREETGSGSGDAVSCGKIDLNSQVQSDPEISRIQIDLNSNVAEEQLNGECDVP